MVVDLGRVLLGVRFVKVICVLFVGQTMEITTISVFAGFMTVLWGIGMRMLYGEISHAVDKINMKSPAFSITGEIKQDIYDLLALALEDTVGNIAMPTASDHIMGALSSFIQHKFMNNLPNLNEGLSDLSGHGQETIQEKEEPFTH